MLVASAGTGGADVPLTIRAFTRLTSGALRRHQQAPVLSRPPRPHFREIPTYGRSYLVAATAALSHYACSAFAVPTGVGEAVAEHGWKASN